jgi:hypothetical protein
MGEAAQIVPASGGKQSLPSGRHIPEGHGTVVLSLQSPLPSHVGVTSVSEGQDGAPQTVPFG